MTLIRRGNHILVTKAESHHSDQEGKEELELPQAVLVQAEEGERIGHRDEDASPEWKVSVGEEEESDIGSMCGRRVIGKGM